MGKSTLGAIAVMLGILGSSFITRFSYTTMYYFPLNRLLGTPLAIAIVPPTSMLYGCNGSTYYCSAAFTQYVTVVRGSHYSAVVTSEVIGSTTYQD